jgi:ABC-type lipoprotein release transport system permease subunit
MGQNIRVYAVQPLSTYIEQSFTSVRWMATALSGFGLLALVLAAIGLYGVVAYRVSLRTREIGVRMALGAGRGEIFREVVLQGLMFAVVGVAIGEVLAIRRAAHSPRCRQAFDPALSLSTSRRLPFGRWLRCLPVTCPPAARRAWIRWKPCGTSEAAFHQRRAASTSA